MLKEGWVNMTDGNTELFKLWVQYEFNISNGCKALQMLEDHWKKNLCLSYYMTDISSDVGSINLMNITELVLRVAPEDRVRTLEKIGQIMQIMRDSEVGYEDECCLYALIFEKAD